MNVKFYKVTICSLLLILSSIAYAQIHKSSNISSRWITITTEEQRPEKSVHNGHFNNFGKTDSKQDQKSGVNKMLWKAELKKPDGLNTWAEETRYYKDIRVDSLWYVGIGEPIPEQTASKMEKVFRLSMKLNNGKFIHVECLERGKQKTSDLFCSMLLPVENYDYNIGECSQWIDAEKRITNIYQYPSTDNNFKSIEIAYDADGHIIHSASIEISNNNQAIIIYYDSLGNIINMTDPQRYKSGTIVLVDFKQKEVKYTISDIGGWPIMKVQ